MSFEVTKCSPDVIERFFESVDISGDCWEWNGQMLRSGYGKFSPHKRGIELAHRFIEIAFNGELEPGQVVMHICDNPSCVRPSHLSRGTQAENLADMRSKNRHVNPPLITGTRHHSNRLTESQVREIHCRRAEGENGKLLAKEYGVSDATIYDIANGKKWKHLSTESEC